MAMKKLEQKKRDFANDEKFKFEEEGDTLEGYYLGSETFEYEGDELTKHRVRRDDGKTVSFIGGSVLNNELPGIPVGSLVRIERGADKKLKGGKHMATYQIDYDDEDCIDVSAQSEQRAAI